MWPRVPLVVRLRADPVKSQLARFTNVVVTCAKGRMRMVLLLEASREGSGDAVRTAPKAMPPAHGAWENPTGEPAWRRRHSTWLDLRAGERTSVQPPACRRGGPVFDRGERRDRVCGHRSAFVGYHASVSQAVTVAGAQPRCGERSTTQPMKEANSCALASGEFFSAGKTRSALRKCQLATTARCRRPPSRARRVGGGAVRQRKRRSLG